MKIRIEDAYEWRVYPPADKRFSAVDDDSYSGPGSKIGTGATPIEAVLDLMEQIRENDQ